MQFNGKENLCFFLLLETNIWSCLVLSGEQDVWGQMMSFFPSYVTTSRGHHEYCVQVVTYSKK